MGKVVEFKRESLKPLLETIEARGPSARGVIAVIMDADGHASFRISGFTGPFDQFTVLGLLDWIKADLLDSTLDAAYEGETS